MNQKVAIVVCAWPPQGGGIGNNAYYHTKELKRRGWQVTAFSPKYKNISKSAAVEYLPVWFKIGKAGLIFSLCKRLKEYDVIHLYYPFFGTDLIVWLFKVLNREKKLVLHYEMDPVGHDWQKIVFWLYLKLFLGLLVRASDKIGVLSWDNAENSYLSKYLARYKNKFVELPNGVDTNIFQPAGKDERLMNKLGISNDDKVIIFVGGLGRLHFFKGVDVLIGAYEQIKTKIPNIKLLIIGDGDQKDRYIKLAGEGVIFTGWVLNEDLSKYYNLSDVFVLPSIARTESFGIVTAEAQACEVPGVVSNWPGSRATIKDGETGLLVKPGDENDLVEKIIRLLSDDKLRHTMGGRGRERVVRKYSWEVVANKIEKIYTDIISNSLNF